MNFFSSVKTWWNRPQTSPSAAATEKTSPRTDAVIAMEAVDAAIAAGEFGPGLRRERGMTSTNEGTFIRFHGREGLVNVSDFLPVHTPGPLLYCTQCKAPTVPGIRRDLSCANGHRLPQSQLYRWAPHTHSPRDRKLSSRVGPTKRTLQDTLAAIQADNSRRPAHISEDS
jgi:hypothetical protein